MLTGSPRSRNHFLRADNSLWRGAVSIGRERGMVRSINLNLKYTLQKVLYYKYIFVNYLYPRQSYTHIIRDKCSNGAKCEGLNSREEPTMFCNISFHSTNSEECDTRHEARELEAPNPKYIRDKRDKADDEKRYKSPEPYGERCFFTEFFRFCWEVGTDRHRRSISEEIRQTEDDNDFTSEISSCRTSYDSKGRHSTINSTIHHLREIVSKYIYHGIFFLSKKESKHANMIGNKTTFAMLVFLPQRVYSGQWKKN